ncbi:MAG TPA: GDP-mannose 4,6-dehydratase [Candidatus Angelobacter sp.]|nr:GDP-mannose 4,6-dehydratase [Candidatus Angelobacter sp.]
MNVLITGGAGFIGSHLAERLLGSGEDVRIIDNLSTGSSRNIQHLEGRPGFQCILDTITNHRLMEKLIHGADIVYHLAAAVGVRLIVDSPTQAMETNIRGTEVVLEIAARQKKRVLITSTSEVYGKRECVPFREDDDLVLGPPEKGRWSYACSKLIDEFLAIAYWKEKGLPTVIARLFNVVGPRQTGRYGMVIPSLVRQALRGDDMTVFGDGTQSRCFTHVNDAVGALIALAESSETNGEVYNIGSTEEIAILQLAVKIKEMTGSKSKIILVPYEKAYKDGFEDMMRRVPDLAKLEQAIGYRPSMNLDEILASTIRYHVEEPDFAVRNGHHHTAGAMAGGY